MINERTPDWHIFQFITSIFTRLFCYGHLTLFALSGVVHFFTTLFATPIALFSLKAYRSACSWIMYFLVPGILCVPVSWRGLRVHTNGLGYLNKFKGQNLLILANHAARIDWLIGQYFGWTKGERVGFITEAFIMMLPFFGWTRYLFGDMFVWRSFKRDKDRLDKNIMSFHKTKSRRWIFLCPEGHIADFGPQDQKYIRDCQEFSQSFGHDPFKMVLTPRYKGMILFNKIMTKGQEGVNATPMSVTMTYVKNGEVCVKPLSSKDRIIPDLWSLVTGGVHCYVHCHTIEMSNEPEVMKKQLMADYAIKDKLLKTFYLKGRFPAGHPDYSNENCPENWKPVSDPAEPFLAEKDMFHVNGKLNLSHSEIEEAKLEKLGRVEQNVWQTFPVDHWFMNLSLFFQMFGSVYFLNFLGYPHAAKYIFFGTYSLLALSHLIGEFLAGGQSRESIPLESLIKALVFRWIGREGAAAEQDACREGNDDQEFGLIDSKAE
eukprot:snap_masked-scaffold_21-processed-gene-1.6-mRNA-1 protein AED:0.07 eAED:1.00 QI:0/-1/0/1/-1/1/1/0/488